MPPKAKKSAFLECTDDNKELPLDSYKPNGVKKRSDDASYPKRLPRRFPPGKYRGFVFTNWKIDWDVKEMEEWPAVVFASVGLETAPTTGNLHHQGCVYFKNSRVCSGVDKLLPPNTWFAPAYGSEMSNDKYTSKGKHRLLLIGKPLQQGERVDIEEIRGRIINDGATPADFACESGMDTDALKFAETVFRLAGNAPKRTWKTSVVWIYGKAGQGKSHIAKALITANDEAEAWKSSAKLDYWQQYQGQETVWLDEFRGDKCTFTALLEIMDSTPYEVNVKYGSCQLMARRIIVTSPMHPDKIYPSCSENVDQMLRRIDALWDIEELYEAAKDGFEFPEIPEFKKFGSVIMACAESKKAAALPMRFEGRKCLELRGTTWVEIPRPPKKQTVVDRSPADSGKAALDQCSGNSSIGGRNGSLKCHQLQSSGPGAEVGGNIRPIMGTPSSTHGLAPTSGITDEHKCSEPHAADIVCEDCVPNDDCPHEEVFDDGFGNMLCFACEAYIEEIDIEDEGDEKFPLNIIIPDMEDPFAKPAHRKQ